MRLRFVSLVAATASAIGLVYFLWPQDAPPPVSAPIAASKQSQAEPERPPLLPPPESNPARQEPGTSTIQGITTDTSGNALEGTDILHRVLAIAPDQRCHDLPGIELELDDTTELLTSDDRGYFSLPFQPSTSPGNSRQCLIINAHKQGYMAATESLPLDINNLPRLVEIELSPNRSITGQVIGPANRPVDGARVIAWQDQESNDGARNCASEGPAAAADTQPDGEFTIHLAENAEYCLQAFHPDWSRSQPHRVTGADRLRLRLQLGNRAGLTGTSVDFHGKPMADLALALVAENPDGRRDEALTRTDGNGAFVFDHLDYARYQLTSASPDYQVAEPQEIVVTEAQPRQEITVTVFPVTVISGRVSDALAQVEVTAYSPFDISATLARTSTNSQGEFRLTSLHRSEIAYETFQMATAMLNTGGAPFSGELCLDFFHPRHGSRTLSLATTNPSLNLESIELQRPPTHIEGRVLNHRDQAVAATLVVTPEAQGQGPEARMPRCDDITLSREISTDTDGRFSFSVANPGIHTVEVRTGRYTTRTMQLDFNASASDVDIKLN